MVSGVAQKNAEIEKIREEMEAEKRKQQQQAAQLAALQAQA